MMKQWIMDNILTLITTVLGGTSFVGYVLERKKRRIEERQLNADALSRMQEAYDKFVEHSNTNYRELLNKYQELTMKYMELEQKYDRVEKELDTLKNQNK